MEIGSYDLESNGLDGGQKLDLSRYILALKRRWWLALGIAVLVTVPWAYYVKQEQPIYEATASIRFRNLTGNNVETPMEDIYEQVTSRTFIEQVVSDLGLVVNIEQNPGTDHFLTRREIFTKFTSTRDPVPGKYVLRLAGDGAFSLVTFDDEEEKEIPVRTGDAYLAFYDTISVNGFSFQLADPKTLPAEVTFTIAPFRTAVKSLQASIGVDLNRSWTLMYVTLRDNDPYIVTQTVNSLARIFIDKSKTTVSSNQTTQLELLRTQVERARMDYEDADRRFTEAKRRAGHGGKGGFEITLNRHSLATKELEALTDQREALEMLLNRIAGSENETTAEGKPRDGRRYVYAAIAASKIFENNPTMAIARQSLEDLQAEREKQLTSKSETHPDVMKLQGQIEQLYEQIEDGARAKSASLNREIAKKQGEVNRLATQMDVLPIQESDLAELQREWDQKSSYYQKLQSDLQKAEISQAVESSSIEILDPAIEPTFPINRNKRAKAATGGVVGLLLGIGLVLALEALDRTIKTVEDAKSSMKLNVLGAIPQINFGEYYDIQDHEKAKMVDQQLVTHDFSPTPIGEAYRSLRTNILFSKTAGRIQTLVITSTAPGDGKSFTAANLSITMAQQKSNTLLVDTDLRRGVLHNTFGVPKEPGFSNYLMGSTLASEITNETHIPNLSVISCGALIPNPSELLGSVQLRRFLDEMRRKYDLIIFDTPPLNAATDAVVLGTQVDGVVVVVRAGKTKKEVARQKIELFHHVQAKVVGVILNGTSVDLAHEGYSYYHY